MSVVCVGGAACKDRCHHMVVHDHLLAFNASSSTNGSAGQYVVLWRDWWLINGSSAVTMHVHTLINAWCELLPLTTSGGTTCQDTVE